MTKEVYEYILNKFFQHNVDLRQNHIKWVTVDKNGLVSAYSFGKPIAKGIVWIPSVQENFGYYDTIYLESEGKDCYVPMDLIDDWHEEITDADNLIKDLDEKCRSFINNSNYEKDKIQRQLHMPVAMMNYLASILCKYRLKIKPNVRFIIADTQGRIVGTDEEPKFDYDSYDFSYENTIKQVFDITNKYKDIIPKDLYNGGLPAIISVNYLKELFTPAIDFCVTRKTMSIDVLNRIIDIMKRNDFQFYDECSNWITVDQSGTIMIHSNTPFIDEEVYGSTWKSLGGCTATVSKCEEDRIPMDIVNNWKNEIIYKDDFLEEFNR